MTAAAHYDSVRTLLVGGILASRVHDVVRVNGDKPVRDNYVVLTPDASQLDDERYTVLQSVDSTARFRYDVRSVATSLSGVLLYQDTVRGRLIGQVPVVAGRSCTPIRLVDPVEEGRATHDSSANLFHITETFEFWSRRA